MRLRPDISQCSELGLVKLYFLVCDGDSDDTQIRYSYEFVSYLFQSRQALLSSLSYCEGVRQLFMHT